MLEENNNFEENQSQSEAPSQEFVTAPEVTYQPVFEKAQKKREIRRVALALGLPMVFCGIISFFWADICVLFATKILGVTVNEVVSLLQDTAVLQIVSIALSMILFVLPFSVSAKILNVRIDRTIQFGLPKKGTFLPFVLVGMGFCSFANVATSFVSNIFSSFGVDYEVTQAENPGGILGFLLILISTAIVPALVEEFAYRGIVLGLLKKFGEGFAIIVSAVLFGIMHSNFEQMPFAIIVGLILGYTYVKTGSIWTCIAIHFINNFTAVGFEYLGNITTANRQNAIILLYFVVSFIASIIGIYLFGKNHNEDFALKKSDVGVTNKEKYIWFFTSWSIILFIIFNLAQSMLYFVF